jgi:NAD(P)-dependent dehydrogenase (short-subunit alcohol dehydrogenase family)
MGKAFDGKVVFVTGANSGIGEGAAAAFHAAAPCVREVVASPDLLIGSR